MNATMMYKNSAHARAARVTVAYAARFASARQPVGRKYPMFIMRLLFSSMVSDERRHK